MSGPRRLYTRYEHGNLAVDIHEEPHGFMLHRKVSLYLQDGTRVDFSSATKFFQHLYGKRNGITFEKYFKLDSDLVEPDGVDNVIDFFQAPQVKARSITPPVQRGIDLEGRWDEVRKLFFSGFGRMVIALGYDPEDLLQEIYKKLVISNQGEHPYDPRKSSFGHYVYMACRSAFLNYHKKEERRKHVRSGVAVFEDNKRVVVDVGDADGSSHRVVATGELVIDPDEIMAKTWAVKSLCTRIGHGTELKRLACRIVVLMSGGCTQRDLPSALGMESRKIRPALELVRIKARVWAQAEGMSTEFLAG